MFDHTWGVKVGQVWQDVDDRMNGRRIKVVRLEVRYAICDVVGAGRQTKIRLDRFKPTSTGYRLIEEA